MNLKGGALVLYAGLGGLLSSSPPGGQGGAQGSGSRVLGLGSVFCVLCSGVLCSVFWGSVYSGSVFCVLGFCVLGVWVLHSVF